MISGNRKLENGMKIDFITRKVVNGEIEVETELEHIIVEVRYWESALIMYVIGRDISVNAIK